MSSLVLSVLEEEGLRAGVWGPEREGNGGEPGASTFEEVQGVWTPDTPRLPQPPPHPKEASDRLDWREPWKAHLPCWWGQREEPTPKWPRLNFPQVQGARVWIRSKVILKTEGEMMFLTCLSFWLHSCTSYSLIIFRNCGLYKLIAHTAARLCTCCYPFN